MQLIFNFVLIISSCLIYPVLIGSITIPQFIVLSVAIGITSTMFHSIIFKKAQEIQQYISAIFIATLSLSIISLYVSFLIVVPTAIISAVMYLIYNRKDRSTTFFKPNLVELFLILTILFIGRDHFESLQNRVSSSNGDYYYFTAVVESISKQSISNCYYDIGAPINYQIGSFAFPMIVKKIFNLTSHTALWGVAMPFYKCIFYLLLFSTFTINKNRSINAVLLFALFNGLTSLNPANIVKLNPQGFIFLASGNANLGGNPGLTAGFTLALILLSSIVNNPTQNKKLFEASLVILILVTKIALFLPAIIFFLLTQISWPLNVKNTLQIGLFALLFIFCYILLYGSQGNSTIHLKPFAYLQEFLGSFRSLQFTSKSGLSISLVTLLIYLTLSTGPRIIIFAFWNKFKPRDKRFIFFILITISCCVIPLLLLDINQIGYHGEILRNMNFDTEQFIRSAFIFFHLYCIYIICIYSIKKSVLSSTIIYSCSAIGLIGYCFTSIKYDNIIDSQQQNWRNNINDHLQDNTIKCIVGESQQFLGQILTADGIGPFFYSGRTGNGGYFNSNKNNYRQQIIDSLQYSPNKAYYIDKLKDQGVKTIITTPITEKIFSSVPVGVVSKESTHIYKIL